jgi:hypothetical protein
MKYRNRIPELGTTISGFADKFQIFVSHLLKMSIRNMQDLNQDCYRGCHFLPSFLRNFPQNSIYKDILIKI